MKQAVGVPSNHGVSVQASLATARTHQMSVTNWLGDVCLYVCAWAATRPSSSLGPAQTYEHTSPSQFVTDI